MRLTTALLGAATAGMPVLEGYQVADPTGYPVLRTSGQSTLYEVQLPNNASYTLGNAKVVKLVGSRYEIGHAYAQLLGEDALDTFEKFAASTFPNAALKATFCAFADWLWDRFAAPYVPDEFHAELEGMKAGSPRGHLSSVDQVARRYATLANLPADPQNIVTMLEYELEKGMPALERDLVNAVIDHLTKCTWCSNGRVPFAPGCDSFAVWGNRTQAGALFTSRNLDWAKDTGIAQHKLVAVVNTPGVPPYAMFGFTSGLGALAGMSSNGITVSEMNADNAKTTFDGPPFPLRLRMILEKSATLKDAQTLWSATNNTDSMNFLIGSAKDSGALVVEAMRGFSGYFVDNDPKEATATCEVGSTGGGKCGKAYAGTGGKTVKIGKPLPQAVWRSNHQFHPENMKTQEPLFNGTTFRYELLHDLITDYEARGVKISNKEAIAMAATLGIKGPNFFSCDAAQFHRGDNVMSIAYAPVVGAGSAYVAWEDGTGASWRPAACTTYVNMDVSQFWQEQEVVV